MNSGLGGGLGPWHLNKGKEMKRSRRIKEDLNSNHCHQKVLLTSIGIYAHMHILLHKFCDMGDKLHNGICVAE